MIIRYLDPWGLGFGDSEFRGEGMWDASQKSPVPKVRGMWFRVRIGFWGPLYYNYQKEPPK